MVELEVPDGPARGRYRTRVENVRDDGSLALAAPMHQGARVSVPTGTPVVVHALKADPVRGARFVGQTRVVGRQEEGAVPLLIVAEPAWERVQLRSWVRVAASVPVRYRPVGVPSPRAGRWIASESRDIGGGGLMLRLKQPLEPGQLVELVVELPERPVEVMAEVVRLQTPAPEDPAPGDSVAALKFVRIAEADRDRIIRFVLRRQAEMRRLGLI